MRVFDFVLESINPQNMLRGNSSL